MAWPFGYRFAGGMGAGAGGSLIKVTNVRDGATITDGLGGEGVEARSGTSIDQDARDTRRCADTPAHAR